VYHDLPFAIRAAWTAIGLIWAAAALAAKPAVRTEAHGSRLGHLVTFAVALTLLFSSAVQTGPLAWRVLPAAPAWTAAGVILTFAGILFALWARFYLGRNWSAIVSIKRNHALVETGPYSIVRHPIYSGLLLAIFGTALAAADLSAFLAVALAFAAWHAKSRLEEHFLLPQFGDAYRVYRAHVRALIPFVL
jgi:protein-S-isoprenylcysteine O-methyltransferase